MKAIKEIALGDLVRGLAGVRAVGDAGVRIKGMAYDSRRCGPGDLFVAVPGTRLDGSGFIARAMEAGASAALAREVPPGVSGAIAADVRLAMGLLAARLAGHPDREMTVIGVTGTNGKTTITYLLESILREAGARPGVIGTINYRYGSKTMPANTTTPESVDVFEMLGEMRAAGVTHAVMEVSSHALDQKRVSGLRLRLAAFTNLTRDHLDYHRDLTDYFAAKKKLFTEVITGEWTEEGGSAGGPPVAALNLDNEAGARLCAELKQRKVRVIGYGIKAQSADVKASDLSLSASGLSARIAAPGQELRVSSRLVGSHNLENILAAAALALALEIDPRAIENGIGKLTRVPGRLEPVDNDAGIKVLVDYAHTPDALEHAVTTCRSLAPRRLITVFGCGGDRDPGKRPLMGRIAVSGSDLAVITSDNPRTEDPQKIIEQIVAGVNAGARRLGQGEDMSGQGEKGFAVEPDRKKAIRLALAAAGRGDIVLIAGKGHEDYQIMGTRKVHFDDREEAGEALKGRGLE